MYFALYAIWLLQDVESFLRGLILFDMVREMRSTEYVTRAEELAPDYARAIRAEFVAFLKKMISLPNWHQLRIM